MTQSLRDLALSDEDFAEPNASADELAADPPRRGRGRPPAFRPAARVPSVAHPPAAPASLSLPVVVSEIRSAEDRFVCRPYGATLMASACVGRQAARAKATHPVPVHLRFCGACLLGEEVAERVRSGSAGTTTGETGAPSVDVAAGEAIAPVDDVPAVQETATRPEHVERHRGWPLFEQADPEKWAPLPDATAPATRADLAALEQRLNQRIIQSTVAILDSLDELRRQVQEHIETSRDSNEVLHRQLSGHVAVGRPGVVAEQLFEILGADPIGFSALQERTGMRRDVLKNALARLSKQGRAETTGTGWVRARGATGGDA